MESINHIFEPHRLVLAWHSPTGNGTRLVVGELCRGDLETYFRYLPGTTDFEQARKEGFFSFPAFDIQKHGANTIHISALDVFMKRLPPRKRADFKDYLRQYNLPTDFAGSDFALLAYTGAKLASDTFELYPDISKAVAPIDFVIDIAGARHYIEHSSELTEGDQLTLVNDDDNRHDKNAVRILHNGKLIGYIGRVYAAGVREIMRSGNLSASVLKVSSFKEKIRVLALLQYR
ncbi:HIRAN domain-containing protein [Pseudomonas sp. OF001]|uniref:HIRAN domain-containing protein n=1 Tax=Pseudomonas sp. OF001 TaxID=2772300 RepID=UPI00191AC86A|nr:HIRAN domain-containing protein [Pseudomonas sp. OF001]CAD5378999.1 HIRAN domain-containing protein [Pseudomonas sp. OF001]